MTPPRPRELYRIYRMLDREVGRIAYLWAIALELYLPPSERPDSCLPLLDRSAKRFFRKLTTAIFRDTVLGVARLLDPPTSTVKGELRANFTLSGLLAHPEVVGDPDLHADLSTIATEIQGEREYFKAFRDRYLAHLDQEQLLEPDLERDSVGIVRLNRAVDLCEQFANRIAAKLGAPQIDYFKQALEDPRGLGALLAALRSADPGVGRHWTPEGPINTPAGEDEYG